MTTRTWNDGTGDWTDPRQWQAGATPRLDDVAVVNAGTLLALGVTLDAGTVDLGSSSAATPAQFDVSATSLGKRFTVQSTQFGRTASFADFGASGFGGTIEAGSINGRFLLSAVDAGTTRGDLVLLGGSVVEVSHGDAIDASGTISSHGLITVGIGSGLINNGVIALAGSTIEVFASATLGGSGTVEIGLGGTVSFQAGAAVSGEALRFTDVGGQLLLADPAAYTGQIGNFQAGDLIDLTAVVADAAFYNAGAGQLSVLENGATVATLRVQGPVSGALTAASDGAGGTLIEMPGTRPRPKYLLAADDRAMRSDIARSTLLTAGGVPISGAGVRIGIISNSFDARPGIGGTDAASAAAVGGYLPLDLATGSSAVTVLGDGSPADDNEGLAMAELVHQVAPGAQLFFASGDGGLGSYAGAVVALQQAGCKVVVDDLTYIEEPFFQSAGPLDAAIAGAVAGGVSYFAAAGNDGAAAFQAPYTPQPTILHGVTTSAEFFANGRPYQALTLLGGVTTTLVLQWAVPWAPIGPIVVQALTAALYDAAGALVGSSLPVADGSGGVLPEQQLTYTASLTGPYQLVLRGSLAIGTQFKYVLLGSRSGGNTLAGTIDDPAANSGTLKGHDMLAGVNSVGAVDFGVTPAFGSPVAATTFYSATGASQFLFDAAGHRLATPVTVAGPTLVGPVGAGTSVTGFASFDGTSAAAPNVAAVAALMLQADPQLTPAQVTAILRESATNLNLPVSQQGAGLVNADRAVQLALAAEAACYAAGTRIATARGMIAVERLRAGDRLRTQSGGFRRLVWLGRRRVDCRRHPRPDQVWPIRVQAHAFAPGQPERDLYLSPDHAVKLEHALVPIRYLVNGATVAQRPVASVTYWHVELETHDVLLAEGLPAESFLDTGNRWAFENGAGPLPRHPDFARAVWRTLACAPLTIDGPVVERARARLLARVGQLGHAMTERPDLHAQARGGGLGMTVQGRRHHVHLRRGAGPLRLRSRRWVPAHLGEADARRLGVAVAGLTLDGEALALDDARLGTGWHAAEADWRWTAGDATIATGGAGTLSFDVALTGRYWNTAALATGRAMA